MRSLLLLTLLLLPSIAQAKDLRNRLGVGFDNQFGQYPALSLRYGLPAKNSAFNVQTELDAGFLADSDNSTVDGLYTGARLLWAFSVEDNMNLYAAAGAGALIDENNTAFRVMPGLSAEFFTFGLENLGFSAEWGLTIDLGSPSAVGTFSALGAHYYF